MPHPAPAVLVLFSLLRPGDLLAHETRARLLALVQRSPGATVTQLATALAIDYKTAEYHARALERGGHVALVKEGRFRRCFPRGQPSSP